MAVVGCGTTVKVYDQGPVDLTQAGAHAGQAPLVLVYRTNFREKEHQIFFWTADKERINVKIPVGASTSEGVLIYLPVKQSYALSGMLVLRNGNWNDLSFGTDLPLFNLHADQLTQLSYFEVNLQPDDWTFSMIKTKPTAQDLYLGAFRKRFQYQGPIHSVDALNLR